MAKALVPVKKKVPAVVKDESTEVTLGFLKEDSEKLLQETEVLVRQLNKLRRGEGPALLKGFNEDAKLTEKIIDDSFERSGTDTYRKRARGTTMLRAMTHPDYAAAVTHRAKLAACLGWRLEVKPSVKIETYEDKDTDAKSVQKTQKKIAKEREGLMEYLNSLGRDRHSKGRIPLEHMLHALSLDYVAFGHCYLELVRDKGGRVVRAFHAPAERMVLMKDGTYMMVDSIQGGDSGSKGSNFQRFIPYLGIFGDKDPERKQYEKLAKDFSLEEQRRLSLKSAVPTNEIVVIRQPSLIDRMYGAPDIAYAYDATITMGLAAIDHNRQWFSNAGVASWAVVISGGTFSRESRIDLENMLSSMKTSRHRTPIFQSPQKDVKIDLKQLDKTPVELAFLETAKAGQQQILSLAKVPPSKLGVVDGANRANMKEQNLIMEDEVLGPDRIGMNWLINLLLTVEVKMVSHNFVLNELRSSTDLEDARQFFTECLGVATTPNEYRERRGLHPVPWGYKPVTTQSDPLIRALMAEILYPNFDPKGGTNNQGRPATNSGGGTSDTQQPATDNTADGEAAIDDAGGGDTTAATAAAGA